MQDHLLERVTLGGALYGCLVLATGVAAFRAANNLLFLLLALMLATMLVSGLIGRLGIAGLELDAQLPDHICARRRTPARLVLRNVKRRIPSFSIRVVGVEGSVEFESGDAEPPRSAGDEHRRQHQREQQKEQVVGRAGRPQVSGAGSP